MYVLPPQTNREFQIKTSPDKCSPKRLKEAIITEISSAPTSARRMLMVSIYNNGSNRKHTAQQGESFIEFGTLGEAHLKAEMSL